MSVIFSDDNIGMIPLNIPGCVGWADMSDLSTITASSGAVSVVRNKANSQLPFIQSPGPNQPVTGAGSIAGNNALTFNGVSQYLTCNGLSAYFTGDDAPVSVVVIYRPQSTAANPTIFSAGNSANTTNIFGHENSGSSNFRIQKRADSGSLTFVSTTVAAVSVPVIMSFSCAGATMKAFKNGLSFFNSTFNATVTTLDTFAIGARVGSSVSSYFQGEIGELAVYNKSISDADVLRLNRYMGNKWGVTLS